MALLWVDRSQLSDAKSVNLSLRISAKGGLDFALFEAKLIRQPPSFPAFLGEKPQSVGGTTIA
jgi:hypothetical protein